MPVVNIIDSSGSQGMFYNSTVQVEGSDTYICHDSRLRLIFAKGIILD